MNKADSAKDKIRYVREILRLHRYAKEQFPLLLPFSLDRSSNLSPLRLPLRRRRSILTDVWVNTKSGKYWKSGSRYYGKTKQGEYMSEKEAVQKGYGPANGTGE